MSDTDTAATSAQIFRDIGQAQVQPANTPFQSPTALAVSLTIALVVKAMLSLGQLVGVVMRVKVLNDAETLGAVVSTLQPQARLADGVVALTGGVGLFVLIACYVIGGMWLYRAAQNVRALGAKGLVTSPGWAIGFFAVPVMNWFRPLLAMSEIWRASHSPDGWRSRPMPPLLGYWWAGWVTTGLVGYVVYAGSKTGNGIPTRLAMNQISVLDLALELITMGLFLAIVWRVTRAQQTTRQIAQQVAETFA